MRTAAFVDLTRLFTLIGVSGCAWLLLGRCSAAATAGTAAGAAAGSAPTYPDPCYAPLCNLQVAFRIESLRETDFIVPSSVHVYSNQYCIKLRNYPDVYCSLDSYRRIIVPYPVYGVHDVYVGTSADDFAVGPSAHWVNVSKVRYYVSSLQDRPLIPSQATVLTPYNSAILQKEWNFTYRLDQLALDFSEHTVVNVLSVSRGDTLLSPRADFMTASNVEPATWFVTVQSQFLAPGVDGSSAAEYGYPLTVYWEFVLNPPQIAALREYSNQWMVAKDIHLKGNDLSAKELSSICANPAYIHGVCEARTKSKSRMNKPPPLRKKNICIWGSNKMDGQKSIWLQQVQDTLPSHFRFTWILTSDNSNTAPGTVYHRLQGIASKYNQSLHRMDVKDFTGADLNDVRVTLIDSPFNRFAIEYSALDNRPTNPDGSIGLSAVEANTKNVRMEEYVYYYASERLRVAGYNVAKISPAWAQVTYATVTEHIRTTACDVVVYGNDRGFNGDVLLRDAAKKILGIPTVAELLNLFMDQEMAPDVVVAPSLSAYRHESIAALKGPKVVIIPPGVDAHTKFNRALIAEADVIHPHDDCRRINAFHAHTTSGTDSTATGDTGTGKRCLHIAFVARLAAEKNVGLFILAAHRALQENPYLRFTLIGDGQLKERLIELVDMLEIAWAVKFLGWLDYTLPRVLAGVDMVVNPSIRGWSETFCIANIEVMSMEIPLVTFAVGGKQ
jgi:glycosyltransferase involved in cell wall biosynthesis